MKGYIRSKITNKLREFQLSIRKTFDYYQSIYFQNIIDEECEKIARREIGFFIADKLLKDKAITKRLMIKNNFSQYRPYNIQYNTEVVILDRNEIGRIIDFIENVIEEEVEFRLNTKPDKEK